MNSLEQMLNNIKLNDIIPNTTTSAPHNNMPPYYALAYIIRIE